MYLDGIFEGVSPPPSPGTAIRLVRREANSPTTWLAGGLTKTPKYCNGKNKRAGKIPQSWRGEETWMARDGLEQLYTFQPKILKLLSKYCSENPTFAMENSHFRWKCCFIKPLFSIKRSFDRDFSTTLIQCHALWLKTRAGFSGHLYNCTDSQGLGKEGKRKKENLI